MVVAPPRKNRFGPIVCESRLSGSTRPPRNDNAKTPDPGLETTIVEEVGSYGRQIGRIADALDVLVGTLDRSKLSEKQLLAIMAFREQLGEVRALKLAGRAVADGDLSKPAAKLVSAALPE